MSDKINIRDKRNGQASLMSRGMLTHPAYAEFFEEVRTDKPVNADLRRTSAKATTKKKRITEPAPEFDATPDVEDEH